MIKKFLKAVIMGLRNCEDIINVAKLFFVMCWFPILVTLILSIFEINLKEEDSLFLFFIACILGPMIIGFIYHCVDAMKYQEENHCDFNTAWKVTSGSDEDEEF